MRPPSETIKGRIVGYDERRGELLIRAPYDDHFTMTKREYRECLVQPVDGRRLSDKQRKCCYALLGAIADWSGYDKAEAKELMKIEFMASELTETADRIFSLSNAPMSLVCAFQRFLVRFIVSRDIPCNFSLLGFVDDVSDYVYACLISKKCCICGKKTELHHVDRVGMGRDREEIVHEGMEALPLCAIHHRECHDMGQGAFEELYHLEGGIELDRTLCRIYKLKVR